MGKVLREKAQRRAVQCAVRCSAVLVVKRKED